MSEVEAIIQLTESVEIGSEFETIVSQVREFEQFLAEMRITIEKKQILLHREDVSPQTVTFNY